MYGVGGERLLPESTLPWLAGYANSAPVRIGNAAAAQHQLDIFGEVADVLYHAHKGGLPISKEGWSVRTKLLKHLEDLWAEPDEGISQPLRSHPRKTSHLRYRPGLSQDQRACRLFGR